MNYEEEIEKLLQLDEIREYYKERPFLQGLAPYALYNLLLKQYQYLQTQATQETQETQEKEKIMQRIEERRIKNQEEFKERQERAYQECQEFLQSELTSHATPPPGVAKQDNADHTDADAKSQLLFIHNQRTFALLKEYHKNAVFIDKILVILSHEFLIYEREIIEIKLSTLLEYLNIDNTKNNIDYIRKNLKIIREFLIERDFIQELRIKKSVLIVELNTLLINELKTQRIITRISKSIMELQNNAYILKRVTSFYENNLKIETSDIKFNSLCKYVIDSNNSRKKGKISNILEFT